MDSIQLNWVDYIFLILVLLTTFAGFSRGLFKEILSIITLVAAYIVASMFSESLAGVITSTDTVQQAMNHMANQPNGNSSISMLAVGAAFGILFLGTVIVGALLNAIINYIFSQNILGIGNRLLGGLFGIAKGVLMVLALVFVVQLTSAGESDFWHKSYVVNTMQPAVEVIGKRASPTLANLKDRFEQSIVKPAANS